MGALILDASVLIGLLDRADAHHDRAVSDVERADRDGSALATAASAYSETLVAFARAKRTAEARDALAGMGIDVCSLTAVIAERAAELRAHYRSLRLPDALVLATARAHDAELLTYDEGLARVASTSSRWG